MTRSVCMPLTQGKRSPKHQYHRTSHNRQMMQASDTTRIVSAANEAIEERSKPMSSIRPKGRRTQKPQNQRGDFWRRGSVQLKGKRGRGEDDYYCDRRHAFRTCHFVNWSMPIARYVVAKTVSLLLFHWRVRWWLSYDCGSRFKDYMLMLLLMEPSERASRWWWILQTVMLQASWCCGAIGINQ